MLGEKLMKLRKKRGMSQQQSGCSSSVPRPLVPKAPRSACFRIADIKSVAEITG